MGVGHKRPRTEGFVRESLRPGGGLMPGGDYVQFPSAVGGRYARADVLFERRILQRSAGIEHPGALEHAAL